MKRLLLLIVILTLVGCSGEGVENNDKEAQREEVSDPEEVVETLEETAPEEKEAVIEYVEKTSEEIALEEEYPDDLPDNKMLNAIHYMSHQKVEAKVKWGHEQITQAKVDRLLAIAKNDVNRYVNKELYIEILERWSAGDFSNAVGDHNAIWEMQGGDDSTNSGKATRLLTTAEEEAYIEHNLEYDLYEKDK